MTDSSTVCKGCGQAFPSRNLVFKHLKDTDGACLSGDNYRDYCKYVRKSEKGQKVLILFGYLPTSHIRTGDDAAQVLTKAIQRRQRQMDTNPNDQDDDEPLEELKYNRSYGHKQHGVDLVAQDEGTGAISEVMIVRLRPLKGETVGQWLDQVQHIVDEQYFLGHNPVPIRILGRQGMPISKFNAEKDVSHRRVEYLLPVDFLSWSAESPQFKLSLERLPIFSENNKHKLGHTDQESTERPDLKTVLHLSKLKKLMQALATRTVTLDMNDQGAVLEKYCSLQKRKGKSRNGGEKKSKIANQQDCSNNKGTGKTSDLAEKATATVKQDHCHRKLQRKRYHNFTPSVMAHEFISYRRLDKMYHRATCNFPDLEENAQHTKPFLVLSMNGDLFLNGQICRVVGVFLAVANGLVDPEICDCLFDEAYPHLIPTPPAPTIGMVACEAYYMMWEGKVKAILSPRNSTNYDKGWNSIDTLHRVQVWQEIVQREIAKQWLSKGRDPSNGRLILEREWTETVLKPWTEKASKHLLEYRKWNQSRGSQTEQVDSQETSDSRTPHQGDSLVPPIDSVDSNVPELFQLVLHHLREVDSSGRWPSTTLKRQLVMIATEDGENDSKDVGSGAPSLMVAHMKAKNNKEARSSAYSYVEGDGGASGSFSVGLMPGGISKQPKSNSFFPELTKAAFELERKLLPGREPSSTIAINRNAQFRPHTDSGAGAGQSTSLIVGLGTYSGGELMVEGKMHDIRYKAIEFNGWKQRHWTMPFQGERYSLVWFTPKGCEGMHGIDLDLTEEVLPVPN